MGETTQAWGKGQVFCQSVCASVSIALKNVVSVMGYEHCDELGTLLK